MELEGLLKILFFLSGAIIGSFLNVCIVRWPQEKSVVSPSSHCPQCKKPILWYDNIPLLSYILLSGKCRHCGAKFSFRYFLVEALTGCIFLFFYRAFGLNWLLVPYLLMVSCFIVATFVDLEHRIIPDEVSVGGMFAGFICSAIFPALHSSSVVRAELLVVGYAVVGLVLVALSAQLLYFRLQKIKLERGEKSFLLICLGLILLQLAALFVPENWSAVYPNSLALAASIQGALLGGALIYCMGLAGEMIFKKEAMGGGDVKLLAMIGAFLGWKLAVLTFFIAPFFGAIVGVVEKIRTKESAIAYGPYLVLGALISLFWGNLIIRWVISGYRL
ncbi:MAG: prepilin peptidase [Candidatus Omnitrophica bacterium]|nr:prepilin peptidase [Candidatus Omnitrophota bacterium]